MGTIKVYYRGNIPNYGSALYIEVRQLVFVYYHVLLVLEGLFRGFSCCAIQSGTLFTINEFQERRQEVRSCRLFSGT